MRVLLFIVILAWISVYVSKEGSVLSAECTVEAKNCSVGQLCTATYEGYFCAEQKGFHYRCALPQCQLARPEFSRYTHAVTLDESTCTKCCRMHLSGSLEIGTKNIYGTILREPGWDGSEWSTPRVCMCYTAA